MKRLLLFLAAVFAFGVICGATLLASGEAEYIGEWSNGSGNVLTITGGTVQFNKDAPIKYRDVTKENEEGSYELELLGAKDPNGFGGNFVVLSFEDDKMQMTVYATSADAGEEDKITAAVSWFRQD